MQATKPFKAEIKARGQLTIPKKIRQMKHLEEGQTVSLVPLGDVVIIMPQRLELDEARRRIAKILKESDVSAEEMLEGLVREREFLYKKRYGKKDR
jgi:bifunctional DNA-binding transcriptional regulator/antitoxin component of YhaV-PrlF toxin-antitoxin module